ncbi:helix-turn-helix domain-containing protein [Reichenbachiella carrageenanivorans]|uniref:Helix-turn-helix domain-containing protein n=1 Tax=Reichenbachiella carrageenanivorans TaxID=2979869 RepID=A0ABY6CZW5_9BACT|nr:response regulator transcription factor [Reichenbachiella carrageenanivorans]UXX79388.1 helix-turn-helix domain-containing protein [Reichenbachiella carrageenanivorans]
MINLRYSYLILVFCLVHRLASGQDTTCEISADRQSSVFGHLSYDGETTVFEDSDGFIWVVTPSFSQAAEDLQPGAYTLEVMDSNSDMVRGNRKKLHIQVSQSFDQTSLIYMLFCGLGFALVVLVIWVKMRLSKLRLYFPIEQSEGESPQENEISAFPLELIKTEGNDYDKTFITQLYALIEKHMNEAEFDLTYLSRELCISRSHFFQKVKALTNETPYELLKSYRLKKAAEMLLQDRMQVSEVYVRCGFKSMAHFSRAFKEKYGVSPGKYKMSI